jgi:amino acid transporter
LFTFAFGAIIGGSWIVLVGEWLKIAGPLGASLAFIAGGVLALVVGYSYAELSSLYPEIGGELVFAIRIFGPRAAHLVSCVLLLLYVGLVAFEAVSISWIISVMFPPVLGPTVYEISGSAVHLGGILVGVGGSVAIAIINYRGARSTGRLQDALTLTKTFTALIFVACGLYGVHGANYQDLFGGVKSGTPPVYGFLLLLSMTPFFFAGFGVITQAIGEADARQFARLGKVLVAVILATMIFYVSIIVVVAGLVPAATLANYDMPAVRAFDAAFGAHVVTLVVLTVGSLGMLTVWNATFFAAVHVLEGMARQGLLPSRWFTRQNQDHSPGGAVLIVLAASLAGTMVGRTLLLPVVSLGGLSVSLLFLFVCTACLVRRRRLPDRVAPFIVPGGVITVWVGLVLSSAMVMISIISLFTGSVHLVPPEIFVIGIWAILGYLMWRLNMRGK